MYKAKNILLTGGCGFIGSSVINYLLKNDKDIFILNIDKLDYCSSEKNIVERSSDRYKFIKGDIQSADLIRFLLNEYKIDTIMHFAAQSHVDNSFGNSIQFTYDNVIGTMKDARPLAPIGSSTDDKLFNGLTFDFAFPRGEDGILEGPDDEGIEEGFYKRGDTILVKSTTTTYPVYLYVRAFENQAVSNGSIFSSPGNLPYNIQGDGLGMFFGYGVSYDTLICE